MGGGEPGSGWRGFFLGGSLKVVVKDSSVMGLRGSWEDKVLSSLDRKEQR